MNRHRWKRSMKIFRRKSMRSNKYGKSDRISGISKEAGRYREAVKTNTTFWRVPDTSCTGRAAEAGRPVYGVRGSFLPERGNAGRYVSGCPLHNLVPETNDLVWRGNWKQAYERLTATHCFPEFTGRVCPALCEAACTCGLNGQPVSTKENEKTIIETAFRNGWVKPHIPKVRTTKKVAVIGSGLPAWLQPII